MLSKEKLLTLGLVILSFLTFQADILYSQDNDDQERMAFGDIKISPSPFNPDTSDKVVVSIMLVYGTREGNFADPQVKTKIDGIREDLPVEIKEEPVPDLPEEAEIKIKKWRLFITWDGKDKFNEVVRPGRYNCKVTASVTKTVIVETENADGQEKEPEEIEKTTSKLFTAPIIISGDSFP